MALSKTAVARVKNVLIDQIGVYPALRLVARLLHQVKGNSSYRKTLQMLQIELEKEWGGKSRFKKWLKQFHGWEAE